MGLEQSKGTILIVDDEPNVLLFLSKVFQPMGYGTLTAQSGEEALRYFEACQEKMDIALVDFELPGVNGVELVKAMRKHQPDLPVIMMSALKDKKTTCESLGIEAFVQKPYSLEDLYENVEAVLEKRASKSPAFQLDPGVQLHAKLMIVDDEVEVSRSIAESLFEDFPNASFRIKCASSGEEALKISKDFEPDIAIIDIKMPNMSGDELINRLKAGEGSCPRDFVIYTGVTDPEIMQKAQHLGHKVLTKPTNIETLYEVLKRICIRHHLLDKGN